MTSVTIAAATSGADRRVRAKGAQPIEAVGVLLDGIRTRASERATTRILVFSGASTGDGVALTSTVQRWSFLVPDAGDERFGGVIAYSRSFPIENPRTNQRHPSADL